MDRLETARALRTNPNRHYNCCQAVLVSFCPEIGLSEEAALALGAHFGGGSVDCRDLLRSAHERGEERQCHCDRQVFEVVADLDELLKQKD